MRAAILHHAVAALVLVSAVASCAGARTAGPPLRSDTLTGAGGERLADLLHLDVDVHVDPFERAVEGTASSWFRGLRDRQSFLELHVDGPRVLGVTDASGRGLSFEVEGERLRVDLAEPLLRGEEEVLRVRFSAKPASGLHFREALRFADEPSPLAFTQGQPNEHRHWLPLWDEPNDRATLEVRARVPEGLEALANGALVAAEGHEDGTRTWHWRLERAVPTYLLALAVGRFDRFRDAAGALELEYVVPAGAGEERARRAFGETPAMLAWMQEHLDEPLPWPRYAQVALEDFVTGGMENAALTFVHDPIVCDAGEALDLGQWPRLLVAHELAHQWFGDLVTCRSWRDLWLNEAFASWMELAWLGQVEGEAARRLWFEEYRERFLRSEGRDLPLSAGWRVAGRCPGPAHHVYTKGPWVVEMLRRHVGASDFDRAIALYLDRHADGLVETADLVRAVDDATGRNVRPLVQQWVEAGGAPRLVVRQEEGAGTVTLRIEQDQPHDALVPLFRLDVVVEVVTDTGRERHVLRHDGRRMDAELPFEGRLLDVVVDPDGDLLVELDHRKPVGQWIAQALDGGDLATARPGTAAVRAWRAVPALGAAAAGEGELALLASEALQSLLAFHARPLLRARAARALSRTGDSQARTGDAQARAALVRAATEDEDAGVRRACLERLRGSGGAALSGEELRLLRGRLDEEPAPRVRALLQSLVGGGS